VSSIIRASEFKSSGTTHTTLMILSPRGRSEAIQQRQELQPTDSTKPSASLSCSTSVVLEKPLPLFNES
jgi:hypothetical protein